MSEIPKNCPLCGSAAMVIDDAGVTYTCGTFYVDDGTGRIELAHVAVPCLGRRIDNLTAERDALRAEVERLKAELEYGWATK